MLVKKKMKIDSKRENSIPTEFRKKESVNYAAMSAKEFVDHIIVTAHSKQRRKAQVSESANAA